MSNWLMVLVVWIVYVAAGGSPSSVDIPWLVTVFCWAFLDLYWAIAMRKSAAPGALRKWWLRPSLLAILPYALFCLPLSSVPILGQRILPRSTAVETAGAVVCASSYCFSIWARCVLGSYWSPTVALVPGHKLIQRGPYAVVRHPIYLGLIVGQLGMMLALGEMRALVFLYGIYLIMRKMKQEENILRSSYPDYRLYTRRVKRLVPWVW
jgi:protein-S-isoprenylcysteine O-methyltransferase Ste14